MNENRSGEKDSGVPKKIPVMNAPREWTFILRSDNVKGMILIPNAHYVKNGGMFKVRKEECGRDVRSLHQTRGARCFSGGPVVVFGG